MGDNEICDNEICDNEICDNEICEECGSVINCVKENIFIITKEEEEIVWCQSCFEDMWEDAANDGWGGDDIENNLLEESQWHG